LRHTDPTTAAKLGISLDAPLRDFLAQYQEAHGLKTRSEVVAQALTLLRDRELETQYAAALQEWTDSGDAAAWDSVSGDAL
jgi:antitoxin ParD1/3/4